MPYIKQPVSPGEPITSAWGNYVQTQYDEAKADIDAIQIDIRRDIERNAKNIHNIMLARKYEGKETEKSGLFFEGFTDTSMVEQTSLHIDTTSRYGEIPLFDVELSQLETGSTIAFASASTNTGIGQDITTTRNLINPRVTFRFTKLGTPTVSIWGRIYTYPGMSLIATSVNSLFTHQLLPSDATNYTFHFPGVNLSPGRYIIGVVRVDGSFSSTNYYNLSHGGNVKPNTGLVTFNANDNTSVQSFTSDLYIIIADDNTPLTGNYQTLEQDMEQNIDEAVLYLTTEMAKNHRAELHGNSSAATQTVGRISDDAYAIQSFKTGLSNVHEVIANVRAWSGPSSTSGFFLTARLYNADHSQLLAIASEEYSLIAMGGDDQRFLRRFTFRNIDLNPNTTYKIVLAMRSGATYPSVDSSLYAILYVNNASDFYSDGQFFRASITQFNNNTPVAVNHDLGWGWIEMKTYDEPDIDFQPSIAVYDTGTIVFESMVRDTTYFRIPQPGWRERRYIKKGVAGRKCKLRFEANKSKATDICRCHDYGVIVF